MRKTFFVGAGVLIVFVSVRGQERIDQDVFWKIRQEGTNNSQILETLQVLTDVYAPRLTGSPNLKAAGEWAVEQMHAWGLTNGHLEPWDFGRPGWLNERLSAHLVSPVKDALVVEALGWTPGTNGVVRGAAVRLTPPQRATQDELNAYFDTLRPTLRGRMVLRNEDYGRIWRLLDGGRPVELEFDIVNRLYPEGRTSYNVVAEIPGTDKAGEVVMLGGHLDAWHAGTGATDNGIGSAVMMEAARILVAVGAEPRRTIRVALWSGEEQGLLGSQAYVREHFGTFEEPKPAYAKFAGYFNIDEGTGRTRGMTVFDPSAAATVLREAISGFRDLGVIGATTTQNRGGGGSDHASFNHAGLPGIHMEQDPIQYESHTWHTNLDTYERIVEDDVKKSAIVIASAVYHLATRDELLPRFTADQMPRRPGSQQQQQPAPAAPQTQTGEGGQ
ncbi:MAG: M20/M25/M40 family metallo-hydrolase [Acidobacteria bacterium]|nr:M20/M25/M40 family metallo-hydrolase [Acidobacteriota bacterium]